jgi:VanZ family protein
MKKVLVDVIRNRRMRYWLPLFAYASLIFHLSSLSYPEKVLPKVLFDFSDRSLHLIEYAVFALLCYPPFRWSAGPRIAQQAVLFVIVTTSFYGMTDEGHQAFVTFRDASWLDWGADTIGVIVGALQAA